MSGEKQGADLFFAGGECLTRHGVWVRRTDMDLEAATQEVHTRNGSATALGRDGILRTWESDTPRAEWLNEVDLDPTRQLLDQPSLGDWTENNSVSVTKERDLSVIGEDAWEILDGSASLQSNVRRAVSVLTLDLNDGDQITASIFVRRQTFVGALSPHWWLRFQGGTAVNHIIGYEPISNTVCDVSGTAIDAFGVEDISATWVRIWLTATSGGGNNVVELRFYPAARDDGTCGAAQNTPTGPTSASAPFLERGLGPPSKYQAVPRDFDRKFPALFLEGASTNEVVFSEDFTGANWVATRASVGPNELVSPDGFQTADRIVEDASNNTHFMQQATDALADNILVTFSVYARAAERRWIKVNCIRKDGVTRGASFDVSALEGGGKVGVVDADVVSAEIHRVANDFFRCSMTIDILSGGSAPLIRLFLADGDDVLSYQGDGASSMFMWGAQVDQAVSSTSYIRTDGLNLSRATDNFFGAFPHPPQEMTVYSRFLEDGTAASDFGLYSINDAARTVPRLDVFGVSGGNYVVRHLDGVDVSTSTPDTNALGLGLGDVVEYLAVLHADGSVEAAATVNGSGPAFGTRGIVVPLSRAWSAPEFWMGSLGSGNVGFNRFLSHKVQRGVRSLDFMRAL